MFSDRVPADLAVNRLTTAIASIRATRRALVDLTESNPTRVGLDYPPDLLAPLGDPRALTYAPSPLGARDAREAVALDYARRGMDISPDRIVLTASSSDAYSTLFKLLAAAGDNVLIPRPSYPLFDHLARLDLVETRPYDLDIHSGWSIDFSSVERALTPRTRAILIVSPNNPTGSFVSAADLDRLAALCAPKGIAIVADEVFADYELTAGAAARAGRAVERRDVLAFSLGGLSKSIGLPQVKLGWMALGGPDALVRAALERLEHICDTYLSVATPVQVAAARLLERGAAIRSQIAARVGENYRSLLALGSGAPSCGVLPSDAGWYAVIQVPSLESEEELVVRLLTVEGVLMHPGYFFDFPRESFLVASLLTPAAAFTDGISRMLGHFDCTVRRT
jgi:aspartate/methionine/tyrosine aminotransferase